MRSWVRWVLLPLALLQCDCGILGRGARTILDVLETACVIANASTATPEEVAKICGIADDLVPALRDVIAAQRVAAAAKMQASEGVCR